MYTHVVNTCRGTFKNTVGFESLVNPFLESHQPRVTKCGH